MTADKSRSAITAAFKDSIPVMLGYVPLGLVFGFLFSQIGGSPPLALLSSFLIYGGASQYMMVPMLAAGVSVAGIAFATAVINLRHIFYGLSLLHKVPARGWQRWYVAFTLTDETYSLLSIMPMGTPLPHILWLCFFNHAWWMIGSFFGALIGSAAQVDLAGLDFVLTTLFAMLTAEQWRRRKSAWPLWAALAGYAAMRFALPEHALAASIAFCVAAGLVWGATRKNQENKRGEGLSFAQGEGK